jgi:ribosomal-protein-alanine N-acetyltransferase
MKRLAVDGLVLAPLTRAHAAAMSAVLADPEIHRYLDDSSPPSAASLHQRYARLESRKSPDGAEQWLNWVVFLADQTAIGFVQATVTSSFEAWVAYAFSSRQWGRGLAFSATQAMLDHLRAEYGVHRLLARVEMENTRSIRLLERLRFGPAAATEMASHRLTSSERLYVR